MLAARWRVEADLPADESAPAAARSLVGEFLHVWGRLTVADDVRLVTSELVTNAVQHAHQTEPLFLEVSGDEHGTLRVALSNGSPVQPIARELTEDDQEGRGTHIINQLTDRSGVHTNQAGGKRVWVEFHQHEPTSRSPQEHSEPQQS